MIIKQGDLKPDLVAVLTDSGKAVDLSEAEEVRILGKRGGVLLFNRVITGCGEDGLVRMLWQSGDTDTRGTIFVEVKATWPNGLPQRFPPNQFMVVTIGQNLG